MTRAWSTVSGPLESAQRSQRPSIMAARPAAAARASAAGRSWRKAWLRLLRRRRSLIFWMRHSAGAVRASAQKESQAETFSGDRKGVVWGKREAVGVHLGGRR